MDSNHVRDKAEDRYAVGTCIPAEDVIINRALQILGERMAARSADSFKDPNAATSFAKLKLGDLQREVFAVLFLDTRHKLIEYREMFSGTIDGCEVHPREVVRAALKVNAAAVILMHNHPSGDTTPSAADRAVTARLKQALALVDTRLLDHVIVSGNTSTSMAAQGLV